MKLPVQLLLAALIGATLCCNTTATGQTTTEIEVLIGQRKYEQALIVTNSLLATEPNNAFAYTAKGLIYVQLSKFDSSLSFLQKSIDIDNDSTWRSAWAHNHLGCAYIGLGQRERAIAELKRTLVLDITVNSAKYARHMLDSLGVELPEKKYPKNYIPDWVTISGENITYMFQDTVGITSAIYKLIAKHETAYRELCKVFEPKLPSKPKYFVWNDRKIAKKVTHYDLGFENPRQCFAHVSRDETAGHLMARMLAFWAWGTPSTGYCKFINAGIGVAFNQEANDKYAIARQIVAKEGITSITEIWENDKKWDDDVLYPIAGAFVTYVHKNLPPEQFKQLVKNQTLEKVKELYGPQFDKIVKDFSLLIGVKG